MNKFYQLLTTEPTILLDGAMGTLLMAAGLEQGAPPEEWNVLFADRLQAMHAAYIEAGSRLILTNSFGGTRYRLELHNLQARTAELNQAAARVARAAADAASHLVVVAGSMGPTGELLAPMGTMTFDEARAAFAEQAEALAEGGVDVLWIETMSDLNEVKAAIDGARAVADLPICVTLSFDTNGRTMMGVKAEQALESLRPYGLAAIGANCGNNLPDTMAAVQAMHQVDPNMPLIAKGNAGIPRWGENGSLVYDGTPAVMAGYAYHVRQMGARLIGACCGSTPAHICAMSAALTGSIPVEQLSMPTKSNANNIAPNPILTPPNGAGRRRERRRQR